jgi:hypothetical protein
MSQGSAKARLLTGVSDSTVVGIDAASGALKEARLLVAEAESLEAWYGPNAYSHYLRKHGKRPSRDEAITIGRLVGGQVGADDGTMQPPLTRADRDRIRAIKARREAASRRYDHILRLQEAIAALSANEDDPVDVIGEGSCLLSEQTISAQLGIAVGWLTRFAREWDERAQRASGESPDAFSCD